MTGTTTAQVMAELAGLDDPKMRAVNERHGDDHGVHLGKLRALAKRLKTQQDLARELWATDDTAARLLAILISRPKAEMKDAPDRLQWAMNHCLAQIGIEHPEHRARAVAVGERLEVLKDYPTPPNCTSPFAPAWIAEMVRRQEEKQAAK